MQIANDSSTIYIGGENMYDYSTVNGIIMTHSALLEKDGFDIVKVHFERPNEDGFDFLWELQFTRYLIFKA